MLQKYSITGASEKPIAIDVFLSDLAGDQAMVIFAHGFKGFKDWGTHHLVAEYFLDHNLNFLKFNFSHNGVSPSGGDNFDDLESFASNTLSKEVFDLNEVVLFAQSGKYFKKPEKLYLIGHSLGGGISIIYASQNPSITKLVTWASISSFKNLWSPAQEEAWKRDGVLHFQNSRTNQQMPIYSGFLDELNQNKKRFDILEASRNISKPWLIVHGDQDTSVPHFHAEQLTAEQPRAELVSVQDADHVFNARHPWSEEVLPPALKRACDASIEFFKRPS